MTPRDRLALHMDPNENQGDEQAHPEVSRLEMELAASNISALSLRVKRTEKTLDRLMALPEIIAAMARADTRRIYG